MTYTSIAATSSWTLSFTGTKCLLGAFADQFRRTLGEQVRTMVATVTAYIATLRLPHRPPGRIRASREETTAQEPSVVNRAALSHARYHLCSAIA
ncbi:hypothetical protein [Candidatus Nitrotoga sp. 1052]|uniref:hypothetical protein n=1 Tax=Candidatus Nitrotoga sp. 1052 TaxID=2886964 RepID=UPI001EF6783D|nr:hypothetical protein [Candidatus Nitrotoga sp. 1052]